MDTCIQEVLDLVEKSYDREDIHSNEMVARINLGQIYRGGDDLLLFLPGWISVPAALILMRKFYEVMGGLTTLSIGIITQSPREPVRFGMDIAELLLIIAKQRSRTEQNKIGFLDFEDIRGGSYSQDLLREHRRIMKQDTNNQYLSRPFAISIDRTDDFSKILNLMFSIDGSNETELIKNIHDEQKLMLEGYKKDSVLTNYRNCLLDILSIFDYDSVEKDMKKATTYGLYMLQKEKKNTDIYRKITKSLSFSLLNNKPCNLIDTYFLTKIFTGGL